jgi:signal transduction histidine kinase
MDRPYPNLIRRLGCWAIYALCAVVCLIAIGGAHAAYFERPKRVLTITTGSRLAPGFMLADRELLQALAKPTTARIETYAENLDLIRFPSEQYGQIFSEYLGAKYAVNPPDLVILLFVGNLEVPGKWLPRLFPNTPIIVAGITEEELRPDQFGPFVRGIAQRLNPHANLELILRLQPEVRRVVVIGGTAEIDRQVLARVRDAAQHFRDKIVIDFWDQLTMEELHRGVTALPRNTAILFAAMFRDGAGGAFVSSQVAHAIAQWANVPMYAMSDADIGSDAVGGSVASIAAYGKRAGELASLVLTGTEVKSLPFETSSDTVPTFNWPALQRWGIPESRLPPGSIVRFRPQSLWEEYRWWIVGALFIFASQAAMIAGLLLQRWHRRRAEMELQRNREALAHVARVATVGELTTSVAHELNQPLGAILSNAEAAEMFLMADPPALDEVRNILADIRNDDQRAGEVIRRMRSLLRKQELAPKSIEINEAVEEVLKLLSIDASARKVSIKFERTADLPRVWCDPVHFQQVLLNLVLNGMEAMNGLPAEKRQVVVRTGPGNNGTVKVAIADSGHGIPVDRLPKLFEPFFTTKKEGLGMGLSIARTIVEAHHGQIWAENNSEIGATFYFTVPVDESEGGVSRVEGRVSRDEGRGAGK